MPAALGALWALVFGVPLGLLAGVRLSRARTPRTHKPAAHGVAGKSVPGKTWTSRPAWLVVVRTLVAVVVLLFVVDTFAFYFGRPMTSFGGLVPLILFNLTVVLVMTMALNIRRREISAGSVAALLAALGFGLVWHLGR